MSYAEYIERINPDQQELVDTLLAKLFPHMGDQERAEMSERVGSELRRFVQLEILRYAEMQYRHLSER